MYRPKNKNELMNLVHNERISLRDIDVSLIDDFSYVFYYSKRLDFLGIERWDVSNAKDMSYMFFNCTKFNHSLLHWKTSNATRMAHCFENCHAYEHSVANWDVQNVITMAYLFHNCKNFHHELDEWNIQKDCNTQKMFGNRGLDKIYTVKGIELE
ncbi:DUF285 domain-containing protein [Campylobacter lari]|nr:DUF285 domain-containing protein [Campylobacter lari]